MFSTVALVCAGVHASIGMRCACEIVLVGYDAAIPLRCTDAMRFARLVSADHVFTLQCDGSSGPMTHFLIGMKPGDAIQVRANQSTGV